MVNGKSEKAQDLPPSNSKWWDKANKYKSEPKQEQQCKHYFIYRTGREIVCRNCNIGFYKDVRTFVKEGKLFFNEQEVF